MTYSLGAKFISELLAMAFAIFLGTSAVANELLPSTKGHSMGYFATAMGFSFAFGISGAWFGGISAQMNPAMFLYLAIRGRLDYGWVEFAVGSVADMIGAFVGGCFTYFYWVSHFWTVPLPQDPDPVSRLVLGPPDALSNDAGRLASAFGDASRPNADETFKDEVVGFGEKLVSGGNSFRDISLRRDDGDTNDAQHNVEDIPWQECRVRGLMAQMESQRLDRAASSTYEESSFYHLPAIDVISENSNGHSRSADVPTATRGTSATPSTSRSTTSSHSSGRMQWQEDCIHQEELDRSIDDVVAGSYSRVRNVAAADTEAGMQAEEAPTNRRKEVHFQVPSLMKKKRPKATMSEIRDAAFEAAIRADQSAKLSIFATRPAKYNRAANFVQEMTATTILIFGIQMLNLRLDIDTNMSAKTAPYTQAMFSSFFITTLVLGLGGTTGFAVNPARDLGPRIAHALLPIPGKGSSEWHYSWVPVLAPLVGACVAAAAMVGMEELYGSGL